jgi:deazaflavin-dependent oxidoreductase (nitroreductase family)
MSLVGRLQRAYLRLHAAVYERTDGRVGHRLTGVPSLMLRTTGARSGRRRTAVLIYSSDGVGYVLVASNHGFDRPPAWLVNVRADPQVEVQVARRRAPATARVVEPGDADYDRLWRVANEGNHGRYDGYQARTGRPIAVVVVTPVRPLS